MIKNIRKEKGVTMITVTIAVIILLIITGILVYNAKDVIYIRNYNALKNDIELLRDKVAEFYNEYGSIPAKIQCTNISTGIESVLNNVELKNKDDFYVLDLQVLDGLTLNYGKDYETVKNMEKVEEYYPDLYIIHKMTHNIFLIGGITTKEGNTTTIHYTDYSEPDKTKVDFRYVDGIKIPDNFYYIGRSEEGNITIGPVIEEEYDSTSLTQYEWQETTDIIENSVLVEGQTMREYTASAKVWNGYYLNKNTNKVIYFDVDVADLFKIGDYISYKPTKSSYIPIEHYSGTSNKDPIATEELKWRYIGEDSDGNPMLISEKETEAKINFNGADGYNNAVNQLDDICKQLYNDNGNLAKDVRNLKMEDIKSKLKDYTLEFINRYNESEVIYNSKKEYTTNVQYPYIYSQENGGIIAENPTRGELKISDRWTTKPQEGANSRNTKLTVTQTYWYKEMYRRDFIDEEYYKIFMQNEENQYYSYWISSRCVNTYSDYCSFGVANVNSGYIGHYEIFNSDGNTGNVTTSFRPVVILKDNIKIVGGEGTKDSEYEIELK